MYIAHQSGIKSVAATLRADQGPCEPISQLSARARERERDWLTRLLASCSQIRVCARERNWLTRLLNFCSQLRACARERDWLTRLLVSCSQLRVRARERELAHKTLGLLLSDQSACKRERDWLTRLLTYILESQVNLIR